MATQTLSTKAQPARPAFWFKLSIPAGNLVQIAGLALGAILLFVDVTQAAAQPALRVFLMLLGWLLVYVSTHALGHYTVGRLVGIRFRGYGVRGTDHPENYPPVFKQMMMALPTFTVMTVKESMSAASPTAKALMFAAGETSTSLFSILVGLYAWKGGLPGGYLFLIIMVVYSALSTVMTAMIPRGDYAKALNALKEKDVRDSTG